jgi:hypothetical protein
MIDLLRIGDFLDAGVRATPSFRGIAESRRATPSYW